MIEIAVNNLAAATGARTVTGEADQVCRGCVIDSRQVEEGTIFVAFPGENVDGNDFASRAVQSGAGAVVMTREPEAELVSLAQDKGCAILLTDDPEEFLLRLAHTYRLELGCLVVGITGSIGKTTTKDVLAAVLAKRYRVWATKGNFNNLIGMPLTVLSAPADTEVLVLEMGMNHFHEIERLSQSANPNLAIVSKIGTSHIGILGSRENIARAKAEIVQGMCAAGDFLPLLVYRGAAMIEIAVNNLAAATGARTVTGEADQVCRGCVIDSRQVEEGTIFVAFPGENVDGNDFASRAVQSGAGAVVMTREPEAELVSLAQDKGCAILLTDDPEEFLLRLAHTYRLELGCLVVGITGSIGKTTTKDVLAAVLAKRYRVWATKGNFNNLIGMPLTVLSAPADTEVLVLEMGMNHFHEIERLSQSANPNLAIVSKIGTSHIGILGSRENIARAKAEIVQGMCAAGDFLPLLVLGGEDDFTPFIRDTFAQPAGIDVMLAGVSDDDEVRARDVRVDDEGRPVFTLDFGQGETIDTMLAIPGVQSVPNAVKAAAVAYRLGVTPEQIDAAFRGLTITGHRQEIKRAKSGARVIDDSYNASAESMAAGLDLLCSLSCTGSRMAILGEMGEMGDEAPRMHELVGAYAAAKKLDMLACVGGELAQLMADAARMMGMDEDRIQVFSDYQQVLDRMGGALEKHDVVLVKGSRFVELDRFVEGVC
mgnify:CR=1 FL=1